jgi:hypothetical protein
VEYLESFLSQILNILGTFSPQIVVILFLICFVGEGLGFTIPALLETVWLTTGYQLSRGGSPFYYVLALLLTAQAGRQFGSLLFFYLSRLTSGPLLRLTDYLHLRRAVNKSSELIHRVNLLSPYSVAMGRLMGLRVPLTLVLGANRKMKVNALGILISSLVFDGTYVILGAIVGTTPVISPYYIVLFFIAGVALMWGLTFLLKRSGRLLSHAGNTSEKAPLSKAAANPVPHKEP